MIRAISVPGFNCRCSFAQLGQVRIPGVDHHQLGALAQGLVDPVADHRVRLDGVGAAGKNEIRIGDLTDGIGHGAASECCRQTGDSRSVSETGAVIDVVGTKHRAGELVQQIVFLIGAAGRTQHPEGAGAVLIFSLLELAGDQVDGLGPRLLP